MLDDATVIWWPETLHAVAEEPTLLAGFAYVVLEEIVDRRVVLMSWSWPTADEQGHLVWPSGPEHDPRTATLSQETLRYQLYRPNRLRRAPRSGDVYASEGDGPGWDSDRPVSDARTLFGGRVYDVSADAREAAKLAYYGAVGTVRTAEMADPSDQELLRSATRRRSRLRAKELRLSPPPRPLSGRHS